VTAIVDSNEPTNAAPGLGCILVVDDNMDDAALARIALRKMNVSKPVAIVPSAEEMISYLKGEGRYADRKLFPYPTLVLIDLRLPQKDGLAAQAWVRSSRKHRHLPIIVISSSERRTALQTAVDLGANGYMVKPFSAAQFDRLATKLRLPLY
jgi:CheY-like chemotaxis protein